MKRLTVKPTAARDRDQVKRVAVEPTASRDRDPVKRVAIKPIAARDRNATKRVIVKPITARDRGPVKRVTIKPIASRDRDPVKRVTVEPIASIDGNLMRRMLIGACRNLEAKRELVDAMNVFPVPDGDTGTNMWLTLRSAVEEIDDENPDPALDRLLDRTARASLIGARGNSGVILSQFFSGFARALRGRLQAGTRELGRAFRRGFEHAFRTVGRPVEGTILTVMRAASHTATARGETDRLNRCDLARWARQIAERARRVQRSTRLMVPALRAARVEDAGGQGFVYLLEAYYQILRHDRVRAATRIMARRAERIRFRIAQRISEPSRFRYCLEFALRKLKVGSGVVKRTLVRLGDSLLIARIEDLVHVHIDTNQPARVRATAARFGEFSPIKLDDNSGPARGGARTALRVIAVATGSGFARIFKNLGAEVVAPSAGRAGTAAFAVGDIVRQAGAGPGKEVLLVTNDRNLVLPGEQARRLTGKRITVVPTGSMPEGVQALLAFDPERPVDANVRAMKESSLRVATGAVGRAVRSGSDRGVRYGSGDYVGIAHDRIVASGATPYRCLAALAARLVAPATELLVLYYGEREKRSSALRAARSLRGMFPGVDIQVYYGGQPVHRYLVGAI